MRGIIATAIFLLFLSVSVFANFSMNIEGDYAFEGTNYTNNTNPTINFEGLDATCDHILLSCNDTLDESVWLQVECVASTDAFDITEETYGCTIDDGDRTVYAREKDSEDPSNTIAEADDSVFFDSTSPTADTVTVDPPLETVDSTNYTGPDFTISTTFSDEGGSGIASCEYTLNGTDWSAATWDNGTCTQDVTGQSEADSLTINMRATDNVGNPATEGTAVEATVDATPPEATDDHDGAMHTPTYEVTITESDNVFDSTKITTYYCVDTDNTCNPTRKIDDGSIVQFGEDERGTTYLRYYSVDAVGNQQGVQSTTVEINQLPTFESATDNDNEETIETGTIVTISTVASDADSGQTISLFVCSIEGATFEGCTATEYCSNEDFEGANPSCNINTTGYSDGTYNWFGFVFDGAGEEAENNAEEEVSGSFTVADTTPPTITVKIPDSHGYSNAKIFAFDVNDAGSGVNLNSIGVDLNTGSSSFNPFDHCEDSENGLNFYCEYTETGISDTDADYLFTVSAADNEENSREINFIFHYDTNPPWNISISHSYDWTNKQKPTFSLSATDEADMSNGGKMQFSCSGNNWSNEVNYSTSYNDFNIISGSDCNNSEGSRGVFVRFKDPAGNWSESTSTTIKVDFTPPEKPTITVDAGDSKVIIRWNTVNDDLSGIATYRIYKNGGFVATANTSPYEMTGLSNGTQYTFNVEAEDKAGNRSMSDGYDATPIGGGTDEGGGDTGGGGGEGGSPDTGKPNISWHYPEDGDTVTGEITLQVEASDDETGVWKVVFYVDDEEIGETNRREDGYYQFDLNTAAYSNDEHTLGAKAIDRSPNHNSRLKEIDVVFENENAPLSDEDKAQAKIDETQEKKESVEELIAELELYNITVPESVLSKSAAAEEKLLLARAHFEDNDFEGAIEYAENTIELFDEILNSLKLSFEKTENFEFDKENASAMFADVGLEKTLSDKAIALLSNIEVSRALKILKVEADGEESYYVIIVLTLKNTSNNSFNLQAIEVIPKEFANNASEINSSQEFETLLEDPIIKFNVQNLTAGSELKIVYGLNEVLSKEDVTWFIEQSLMEKFKAPPIILGSNIKIGETSFSAPTSPVAFLLLIENTLIFGIIAVLVICAVILFFAWKRMDKETTDTSLSAFASEKTPIHHRALESLAEFVRRRGKGDSGNSGGRWAFKG